MTQMPDYVTAFNLKNFVKTKTPFYAGIVDEYLAQAPSHNLRADYALFHCLMFTNYFRIRQALNDFGGGPAQNTAIGVELALKKLALLGDWMNLPTSEYEGMKRVESEFLAFVGVKPDSELPTPVPVPLPTPDPKPAPEPVPTPVEPPKPAPSPSGFWSFIRTLAGVLGALNAVMFLLRIWLPGPVVTVLQAVIKFIVDLAAAHPAQATAIVVSTAIATHAIALKTAVPRVWQRIDKNSN